MPRTLTEAEAQGNFSQLITDVCNGAEVLIARGKTPIARLLPIEQDGSTKNNRQWKEKIAAIRALRKEAVIGPPITIEEIISARDEGRSGMNTATYW